MAPKPVEQLTEAEALDELTALADEIARHDIAYHQQDDPAISDADYDALKRRNGELEARFPHLIRDNSPSLRVGAARSEQFAPVEHASRRPAGSSGTAPATEPRSGGRWSRPEPRPRKATPLRNNVTGFDRIAFVSSSSISARLLRTISL